MSRSYHKRRPDHDTLDDSGRVPHVEADALLQKLRNTPITVTGARDDAEAALANLLSALAELGLIVDSTTAT